MTDMTETPTITPVRPAPQKRAAAPAQGGEPFGRVHSGQEWSRLVQYYAECLERENLQQYQLEPAGLHLIACEREEVFRVMRGESSMEFPAVRKPQPNAITRFIEIQRDKSDLRLCLGFPFLVFEGGDFRQAKTKAAPLLYAPLQWREEENVFTMASEGYEVSVAALKALEMDEDAINLFLDELEDLAVEPGGDRLALLAQRLIEQVNDAYGEALPEVQTCDQPAALCVRPGLFWVSENTATTQLIKELKELAAPERWENASPPVRQLLTLLPEHSYPQAPPAEADEAVYVTPINAEQRRVAAAARTEPVVVVTGPPGTGKSQLALNLLAQAFLNGETVLFASRNNRAVDVVIDRLRGELRFQGAVRTGNKSVRRSAAAEMKTSLAAISLSAPAVDLDELHARRQAAQRREQQEEAQLAEIRRLAGLAASHQEERQRLARLLQAHAALLEAEVVPAYRAMEMEILLEGTAALHNRALKLKEEKLRLAARFKEVFIENCLQAGLLLYLEELRQAAAPFAGSALRKDRFERLPDLEAQLHLWEAFIRSYELFCLLQAARRRRQELQGQAEAAAEALDPAQRDEAELLADEFEVGLLQQAGQQARDLAAAWERLAGRRLSFLQRLLLRLGLQKPASPLAQAYEQLFIRLGMQPEAGPAAGAELELMKRAGGYAASTSRLAATLALAGLRRELAAAQQRQEELSAALAAAQEPLPRSLRDDFRALTPQEVDNAPLLAEAAALLARSQELRTEAAALAESAAHKLGQNRDALEMLQEFLDRAGERAAALLAFDPQAEIESLLGQLAAWRNLAVFWDNEARLQTLQAQLSELPSEAQAVEAVRRATADLLEAGGEILRRTWEKRSRAMPNAVVQGALDYARAVELLSQDGSNYPYGALKDAEKQNLRHAVRIFPVWATTNLSARSNFPLQAGYFDLAIIDEASQCDVPSTLPLLYRARRVVIIGDPNQLHHVATLSNEADQEIAARRGIALDSFSYRSHSLYDIAERAVGASQPGVLLLKEHYRSDRRVIAFSNRCFYNDQLVIRTDFGRRGVPADFVARFGGVYWLKVDGRAEHPRGGSALNRDEVRAIQQLIPLLKESLARRGMAGASIGVVSPYREQEEHIARWLREQFGENHQFTVGTAHKFQGDERDIMVFSTVLGKGLKEGSLRWLENTRNLLNVAVTRARICLVVVGDWEYCAGLPQNHCFRQLADYAAETPGCILDEIGRLPLLAPPGVEIVGVLVGPSSAEFARTTLRRFIASCLDYAWWVDPYFDDRVFDLLWDVFQEPGTRLRQVRLLAAEESFEARENRPPKLTAERYLSLQSDLGSRGVELEMRTLPTPRLPHDRLFYTPGQAVNMPPFHNAYGQHSRLSEYTRSSTTSEAFVELWEKARPV